MKGPLRPFIWSMIAFLYLFGCKEEKKVLAPILLEIDDVSEIIPLTDSLVKPALYHNIGGFDTLSVEENKEKFIAVILPAILIVKYRIQRDLNQVYQLLIKSTWNAEDSTFYLSQIERFDANDSSDLIIRMKTHPNSIVLAQAVVESGWGTSRFFSQANNLFGIWSYNPDKPRIAANSKRSSVYLRKYKDLSGSVMDYFETIARARAYRHFREQRNKTTDIAKLLPLLKSYSSRGDDYVTQLSTIINQNDFQRYDQYQLDPAYYVAE